MILLSILIIIIAINYCGVLFKEGRSWVIKKGKHYSQLSWFPLILKRRKLSSNYYVAFNINKTMLQDLPGTEDDEDWNKIFGEGFLTKESIKFTLKNKKAPHHHTSWRVGWSYLPEQQLVQLALYYYQDGLRKFTPLHSFRWNNDWDADWMEPQFVLTVYHGTKSINFELESNYMAQPLNVYIPSNKSFRGWTYRLRPFFGGNQPATQDTRVFYRYE